MAMMQNEMENLNASITVLLESVTRVGSLMVARQATIALQRAIVAVNTEETRSLVPFQSLPGDYSLKRKDPIVLGGSSSKKMNRMAAASSSVPKFIANKKSGKTGSGRSLGDQLRNSKDHLVSDHQVSDPTSHDIPNKKARRKGRHGAANKKAANKKRHRLGVPKSRATGALLSTIAAKKANKSPQLGDSTSRAALSPQRLTEVPNSNGRNEDNRCELCSAIGGSYGHTCCICGTPICSLGLALQNNCPIMENPNGNGVCCTAHFS